MFTVWRMIEYISLTPKPKQIKIKSIKVFLEWPKWRRPFFFWRIEKIWNCSSNWCCACLMPWMIMCCQQSIESQSRFRTTTRAKTVRCRRRGRCGRVGANDWVANVVRRSQCTRAIITAIGPDDERHPRQTSAPSFGDKLRLRNVTGGAFKNSTKHDAQHGSAGALRALTVGLLWRGSHFVRWLDVVVLPTLRSVTRRRRRL